MNDKPAPPKSIHEEIDWAPAANLPEQEAYLNIVRTGAKLTYDFEKLFREHGLSGAMHNALRIVTAAGKGGIHSEEIGKRMIGYDPDTTRIVDQLVKRGLVSRCRSEQDRRCVIVTATAAGRKIIRKLTPALQALHRRQLGHLPAKDLKELSRILLAARHR